ncbi:protein Turandot Z [Drosophila subobscura]|uniref:protein Turandot Z n=1 Tax=Drosophila subobscura TaxID=7241 RepID=UPI00155AB0AD|nr:protein Turandot Z [Drosophila subobscura]
MSPLIHLSCVFALLICLTGSISANPIADDHDRLLQLLANANPADDAELLQSTTDAIALYKKYAPSTPDDDLDREVRKFESENITVDGVPIQGGFWSSIRSAADKVPQEVKDQAKELAKQSAKALFNKLTDYLKAKISSK